MHPFITTLNKGQNSVLRNLMGRIIVTPILSTALFALLVGSIERSPIYITLGVVPFLAYAVACFIVGKKIKN